MFARNDFVTNAEKERPTLHSHKPHNFAKRCAEFRGRGTRAQLGGPAEPPRPDALPGFPATARRRLGRSARGASRSRRERGLRDPLAPDKGARWTPGAGQGREDAGFARRGRRPQLWTLTFEDRVELLQGHVPELPGASRGAEEATKRRRLKRGAHGSARRQPRSVPIARHQVAARGVGLRSCGPPCPSLLTRSRAAPAPRRAPPPAPRRSVPSTASQPGSADARDRTCAGRSAFGRGANPAVVAGAASPRSFKQGARAPRAGRTAFAHVPAPRPRPRAPRNPPGQSPGEPARGLAPWVGGAPRWRPLCWGRGEKIRGAALSPALREAGAEGEPGLRPAAPGRGVSGSEPSRPAA